VVTAILVVGFAHLTALAAQFTVPLPFTPVPITGQTFAVLLAGAVLGSRVGAASQALYLALGIVGLPYFADGGSGWNVVTGATGGYLIGFIVAAYVVGLFAENKKDRNVMTAISTFFVGNVVIYAIGVPWLAAMANINAAKAVELGMAPFVIGDIIKIALAAGLLPAAWQLVNAMRKGS
jgi:biotin transport system substrate-specific component